MIKKGFGALLSMVLVLTVVSFALARDAPKQAAFMAQAVIVTDVAPIVQSVPPMTAGYDVICNLSQQTVRADTSATSRLSATVDWRGRYLPNYNLTRPVPETVLLV